MSKKKNLWIFHHYATPPNINGFTRPYNFGKFLKDANYDMKVFSSSFLHFSETNLINDKSKYLVDNYNGIPFIFVKTFSGKGNGVKRILNMISYYFSLFKVTKEFIRNKDIPDIILASSPHPLALIAGIRISKRLNVPVITEIRDFWPEVFFMSGKLKEDGLIGKILLRIEYWIYKNSDALIFLKEGDFEYINERQWSTDQGGEIDLNKIHYINNGVDTNGFNNQLKEFELRDEDLENDKFNVVYTGAIRPINNIGNILDAAKELESFKDIQFLIFGEGNQLDELKQRVEVENIKNLKFKGYVDKKFIPSILSKSSVNLLNYSQTNYNWSRGNSSNKLFEYMASGKPIISTIKMGYSPIEKYKCGVSLTSNTPEQLADAVLNIKNLEMNEYQAMCENSKNASEHYDYSVLSEKLWSVLEETIKNYK